MLHAAASMRTRASAALVHTRVARPVGALAAAAASSPSSAAALLSSLLPRPHAAATPTVRPFTSQRALGQKHGSRTSGRGAHESQSYSHSSASAEPEAASASHQSADGGQADSSSSTPSSSSSTSVSRSSSSSSSKPPRVLNPEARALAHSARSYTEPVPSLDIPSALQTILELVERPSSDIARAFSKTPGIEAKQKALPVPASVQVTAMDPLLDAFDPTLARAQAEGDMATLQAHAAKREVSIEEFLKGREVVVDDPKRSFSLGDSRFSPTESSGSLDPDILHEVALTGKTETALAKGRKYAVQLSLNELMDVADKYHERAVARSNHLHSTLSSPLAKRSMPTMSARSESAAPYKSRQLKELESIFEVIEAKAHPKPYHFTVMINAYGREGFIADAEKLFEDMLASKEDARPYKLANFFPDEAACNSMINMYDYTIRTYCRTHRAEVDKYTEKARQVIRTMSQHNIKKDVRTYTSMMTLLCNQLPYATPERAKLLVKESLELFEFMQTPAGGSLIPNRRSFAVLIQAFALAGDHTASAALVRQMMTTQPFFPSMAIMNGWLKAAAFQCGSVAPMPQPGEKSQVDFKPVENIISLMRTFHLEPNEHSVASVIKGLAQAGQVQKALEVHDRLEHGSLGVARPTRMTYTALLSVLINDQHIPMSQCIATYEKALADPSIFKSPTKRKGSLLDLRVVGNHPELYSIALTKQLHGFLQEYMRLLKEAREARDKLPRRARSKLPPFSEVEKQLLDQIVPARGWLILTGRHSGDMDLTVTEEGLILPTGFESKNGVLEFEVEDDLDHLQDEFPDDADYSEWDDTGLLEAGSKSNIRRRYPLLSKSARGPQRIARALNTLHTYPVSNAYGRVAHKYLMSQTPSITTTLMHQFEKENKEEQERIKEERRKEEQEIRQQTMADANPAAATTPDANSTSTALTSSPSSSFSPLSPFSSRRPSWQPEPPTKKDDLNEGMLVVRRPVLHFWLRCHAHVLRVHELAKEKRASLDPDEVAALLPVVVNEPPFLSHHQKGEWWQAIAESIELQHGLAVAKTSFQQAEEQQKLGDYFRRQKEWRRQQTYKGTKRDGTPIESQQQQTQEVEEKKKASWEGPTPNWSVRNRSLAPKQMSKKKKPKMRIL